MSLFLFQLGLLLLLAKPSATPAPPAPEPPKPTVNISFARQTIRENDCVAIEVWFANDGKQEIQDVTMEVASPTFLRWTLNPCQTKDTASGHSFTLEPALAQPPTGAAATAPATAGQEPALTGSVYARKLYLKTDTDIEVGDYNLLFTFHYSWKASGKKADEKITHSFTASEKTIKANFLGSESVAGVPLGLAGLIVPGLFFWLTVRVLGVAWGLETALGDKLVYSVVVSFIFVALASALVGVIPKLHYLDISSGISIHKLMWLAGTGTAVGLAASVIYHVRRRGREKHAAETEINFNDDNAAMIGKLLRKNSTYHPPRLVRWFRKSFNKPFPNYRPQTTVTLIDGNVYAGSLGERGKDITVLVGWFQVDHGQGVAELESLRSKGLLFELFNEAKRQPLTVRGRNVVRELADGAFNDTAVYYKCWPSSNVLQVVLEPGKSTEEALVLEA
jgi:hypothetical protein